ncbi:MAG: AAA family ATPase, partial [Candidatus Accumulibacter sp.]|uniref:AAA family ATPase n=1 Tax=Accumulibacter sp. TaxID=2053492 RepID=UPI00258F4E36
MKITAIKTSNFLGARDVDVKLAKPICLFAGKNFSGKSSLQEAVRMALTGESVRVSLKKEYGRLITEGQTVGYAVVEHDGQQSAITLPNGAHEHTGNDRLPAVLPYVLDAQRFSSLPANDRRAFLFGLMGLRTDGETVGARLLVKGCDHIKADEIRPHLRAGFDAAHKEAQSKARDAKASWRATTGETYGSVKAANWKANKPAHDGNRVKLAREELARVSEQIENGAVEIAVMQSAAARQAQESVKVAGYREKAAKYAGIEAKLRYDESELKKWQALFDQESARVGKQMPTEPTYTCPACSVLLRHSHANGALVEFTQPPIVSTGDPGKLAEYHRSRDLYVRCVENDKRDLKDADMAAQMLAEI